MKFQDKVVIVTEDAGGIGLATAKAFTVNAYDDPKVTGVTCYVSERGRLPELL